MFSRIVLFIFPFPSWSKIPSEMLLKIFQMSFQTDYHKPRKKKSQYFPQHRTNTRSYYVRNSSLYYPQSWFIIIKCKLQKYTDSSLFYIPNKPLCCENHNFLHKEKDHAFSDC